MGHIIIRKVISAACLLLTVATDAILTQKQVSEVLAVLQIYLKAVYNQNISDCETTS